MPGANYHLQGVREVILGAITEERVQSLRGSSLLSLGETGLSDSVVNNLIPLCH